MVMKKIFLSVVMCAVSVVAAVAQFRVVANRDMGNGYHPQFKTGTVLSYTGSENIANEVSQSTNGSLRVDNSDLKLNLYRDGVKTVLTPHGTDVNYVWSSLSPDGAMILFNTRRGTAICNLQGKEIINLGNINAPVWYGSKYVVGMDDNSNGNAYTSSSLVIVSIDGKTRQQLTSEDEIAMFPTVNAENGFIAYNTINGRIKVMKISSNNTFTADDTKDIVLVDAMPPIGKIGEDGTTQVFVQPKDVKIYINPGHGGLDSDDRNVSLDGIDDVDAFWESRSNLTKGMLLDSILRSLGFQTCMSRRDNADDSDRSLAAVAAEANAWKADFMISLHSNAGSGNSNYVLELFAGTDTDDMQEYPTASLRMQESKAVAALIAENLYSNRITTWTTENYYVYGDKSYASKSLGWQDGYGVLRGLTVPGCISEGSMHDYIPEAYRMLNSDYQYLEAWNIAKAVYSYFCNGKMKDGIVAGQVRDKYNKLSDVEYWQIRNSRDELLPLNNAKVTLIKDNKIISTTTTDNMQNGVFVFRDVPQGVYNLKVEYDNYYTEESEIEVVGNNVTYQDMMLNKVRTNRPQVPSYAPSVDLTDSVDIMTPIRIEFSTDMLADSVLKAFSIDPKVEGTLSLTQSQHVLCFIPKDGYEINTEYTVKISTSACHPDFNNPNHLADELSFSFRTKNRANLSLVMNYPYEGDINVPATSDIVLLFDQQLLNATQDGMFTLMSEHNDLTIDDSMLEIKSLGQYGYARINVGKYLLPGTSYTLDINPALADINHIKIARNSALHFTTASENQIQSNIELLNGFEDVFMTMSEERSKYVMNYDITLNESMANEGMYCNSIRYSFEDGQDEMLFLVPTYLNYIFTSKDTLMLDVYGDFSFNTIYIEFSIDGDIHQLRLCDLDYTGWRTYSLSLGELPDNINYQFTGIRLLRNDNVMSQSGEVMFDALCRIQGIKAAVDNTLADGIFVFPNPVNDIISIRGIDTDCSLQLFTASGRLIRTCKGMEMTANGLTTGTYILRISTPQGIIIKEILKR